MRLLNYLIAFLERTYKGSFCKNPHTLIAKALHQNSHRKNKKFIVINGGAFNENLLESELFGHAKGSFTGAMVLINAGSDKKSKVYPKICR